MSAAKRVLIDTIMRTAKQFVEKRMNTSQYNNKNTMNSNMLYGVVWTIQGVVNRMRTNGHNVKRLYTDLAGGDVGFVAYYNSNSNRNLPGISQMSDVREYLKTFSVANLNILLDELMAKILRTRQRVKNSNTRASRLYKKQTDEVNNFLNTLPRGVSDPLRKYMTKNVKNSIRVKTPTKRSLKLINTSQLKKLPF